MQINPRLDLSKAFLNGFLEPCRMQYRAKSQAYLNHHVLKLGQQSQSLQSLDWKSCQASSSQVLDHDEQLQMNEGIQDHQSAIWNSVERTFLPVYRREQLDRKAHHLRQAQGRWTLLSCLRPFSNWFDHLHQLRSCWRYWGAWLLWGFRPLFRWVLRTVHPDGESWQHSVCLLHPLPVLLCNWHRFQVFFRGYIFLKWLAFLEIVLFN